MKLFSPKTINRPVTTVEQADVAGESSIRNWAITESIHCSPARHQDQTTQRYMVDSMFEVNGKLCPTRRRYNQAIWRLERAQRLKKEFQGSSRPQLYYGMVISHFKQAWRSGLPLVWPLARRHCHGLIQCRCFSRKTCRLVLRFEHQILINLPKMTFNFCVIFQERLV